jgi:hypothetical protein
MILDDFVLWTCNYWRAKEALWGEVWEHRSGRRGAANIPRTKWMLLHSRIWVGRRTAKATRPVTQGWQRTSRPR